MSIDGFDPFLELGLSSSAASEPELVKAAFKALAKKYHPDNYPMHSPDKALAEEKMRRLNEAQAKILAGDYAFESAPVVSVQEQQQQKIVPVEPSFEPDPKPSAGANPLRQGKKPSSMMSTVSIAVACVIFLIVVLFPGLLSNFYLRQAESLEHQGRLEEALELASKAADSDPRNGSSFLLRARLSLRLGHPERARVDLANARGLVPQAQWQKLNDEIEAWHREGNPPDLASPSPEPARGEPISRKGSK